MNILIKNKGVIRYLRSRGISYGELGAKIGMNESTIRRKIVGERPLAIDEWQRILKAYPSLRYYEKKGEL